MGVDGYLILDLTEEDIEEELDIKTKLHRRKILKGIEVLKGYATYLKQKQNGEKEEIVRDKQLVKKKTTIHNNNIKSEYNEYPSNTQIEGQSSGNEERKIVIKSIEGPNDMNFTITT